MKELQQFFRKINNVYEVRWQEVHRRSAEMAPHCWPLFWSEWWIAFYGKFKYVTICDLHSPTRYDVLDNFSFYLKSLDQKMKGVIAVFPNILLITSRDRKCVRVARKWQHAVRILLAVFWALHEVSSSKTDWENAFFCKIYVCDHLWPSWSSKGHRSWCEMKDHIWFPVYE